MPNIDLQAALPILASIAVGLIAFVLARGVWRSLEADARSSVLKQSVSNWRLGLLGATGVVLSLASGWTTWDGMRNFTGEPLLSLMITFGIQGVMLIVAWLIGETFATGMSHRPAPRTASDGNGAPASLSVVWRLLQRNAAGIGLLIGAFVAVAIALLAIDAMGFRVDASYQAATFSGISSDLLLAALVALFVIAVVGAAATAGHQVWGDYIQALRIMVRSAVLWVMFLACMATSVFFSFDSLFSTIFPQSERVRAAELRAQNQVAGVVSDIGNVTVRQRLAETERLFESRAWDAYDRELAGLVTFADDAKVQLADQIRTEITNRNRSLAQLQEDRRSAESGQAGLINRKQRLSADRDRLRADRPEALAQANTFKTTVAEIEQRVDAARATMLAEERGVEGSGRAGRGPFWRAAREELRKVQAELEVAQARLKTRTDRLNQIDERIAQIETTIAGVDAELAQLRGQAQTAEQLLARQQAAQPEASTQQIDPTAGLAELEQLRQDFRQQPTSERLAKIQQLCVAIKSAGMKIATLVDRAGQINCDPGAASEQAARVFALNTGIAALSANCLGGDKLPKAGGADALFGFARQCVQDSGLPSDATTALRRQINIIELNRDDKAHRFVVTTNAFNDGNKLAYLALAIAIAIDALVFMSGLFGANALRSPLTDVPSHKGRSARQLETIVRQGLSPNEGETARIALESLVPRVASSVSASSGYAVPLDGWTHEATAPDMDNSRTPLARALRAGATISAVQRDASRPAAYLVRGEYVEFLNIVASEDAEADTLRRETADLRKILVVALQPNVGDHADVVRAYMRPSDAPDFSSEVSVGEIENTPHQLIVRNALNAGATFNGYVVRDPERRSSETYLIASEFYQTIALIAAESPRTGQISGNLLSTAAPAAIAAAAPPTQVPAPAQNIDDATITLPDQSGANPVRAGLQPDQVDILRAEFLQALGMDESEYGWALDNAGAATAAESTLVDLARKQDRLGTQLHTAINEADAAIAQVDNVHARQLNGNEPALAVLAGVRRDIEALLPLLLLAPGGQYDRIISTVIRDLEQAENGTDGGLRPDEAHHLSRLKAHRAAVRGDRSADDVLASMRGHLDSEVDPEAEALETAGAAFDTNVEPLHGHQRRSG
ncbi:MAG: hypothetical protein AAFR23_03175 [Pseudomonadota bacterium]